MLLFACSQMKLQERQYFFILKGGCIFLFKDSIWGVHDVMIDLVESCNSLRVSAPNQLRLLGASELYGAWMIHWLLSLDRFRNFESRHR
jgi:hypothetical protein